MQGPLSRAMAAFAAAYHARSDLVAEQRGWSCRIALRAADSGETFTVRVEDGRIAAWDDAAEPTVIVTSDEATLRDILELRRGPNEPYLFGELTVRGPEADFFRLDYITARLCPE